MLCLSLSHCTVLYLTPNMLCFARALAVSFSLATQLGYNPKRPDLPDL
jgi:hypothetical protein